MYTIFHADSAHYEMILHVISLRFSVHHKEQKDGNFGWNWQPSEGICEGAWVVPGDFSITKLANERRYGGGNSTAKEDFPNIMGELEVVNPPLSGGSFTWARGQTRSVFPKLTKNPLSPFLFLIAMEG